MILAVNLLFADKSPTIAPKHQPAKTISFFAKHKFTLIFWTITAIAVLVRVVAFAVVPSGLNADEASMLYDAYSLGKYGVDRNGASFPVYFEAWGDGQNALLTYLTIPFVLAFGINVFTARIVSLIFALISLLVFYYLVRKLFDQQGLALVCFALFALCPYNIMMARWGLESNLFPHFLLYGITFLVKTYHDHVGFIFPACLFFGIGLYAYAIAYLVIPLLLVGVYIYFIVKQKINRHNIGAFVAANLLLLLLALPLILFLMVNQGWLAEIHVGVITIVKMRAYRGGEIALSNVGLSFFMLCGILLGQNDLLLHNSPLNLGVLYLVTVPFMLLGIVKLIIHWRQHKENFNDFLLSWWLVTSLTVALLTKWPNINKINSLWFVLIILTGWGIWEFVKHSRVVFSGMIICLVILFTTFCGMYFTTYNKQNAVNFNAGLMDSINYAKQISTENENIYFSRDLHEPYIYCLIVDAKSPDEFLATRQFSDPKTVVSYGRYQFEQTIDVITDEQIYIMPLDEFVDKFQAELPTEAYRVFDNFVVVRA